MTKFDLIIQNNSTKETRLYAGLESISSSPLYYTFNLDSDLDGGEYSYWLLCNQRSDVEYEFKDVVLDSILHTNEGDIQLRYVRHLTGLMRVGDKQEQKEVYVQRDKEITYITRKKIK